MKELFEKKVNLILIVVVIVVAILIGIPVLSRGGCFISTSNSEVETKPATHDEATPDEETTESTTSDVLIEDSKVPLKKKNADNSSTVSASEKTDPRKTSSGSSTSSNTKKKKTESKVFATAPKAENPADHNAQWNAGFLVAIDSPDTSYYCGHVELSDKDRETLEKLCMGEFGSGGFTGAAMIAQAVKNAMYFDGYTSVQAVIDNYHYTGRLTTPTQRVKDAVVYIFDMDKDAIQHRILYMYNPELMDKGYSKFHEKQKYICTLGDVRFFDR